jgi:hypothetical protein
MTGLLDDQIAPERRVAALARLRKYTGVEAGLHTDHAGGSGAVSRQVEYSGAGRTLAGICRKESVQHQRVREWHRPAARKVQIREYQDVYAKLKEQLAAYDNFVRKEVLPKSRKDFRLPAEMYTIALDGYGVDYSPSDLVRLAHQAFTDIQGEMKPLAAKIAKERRLPSSDYRDVVKVLKKDQIPADQVLSHYQTRLCRYRGDHSP